MAAFIATKAVDMGDLSELGLLSNFKQLKTPSVTDLSSFTATKGNVSLFITGSHMTAVLKVPSSGTMDGIQVSIGGKVQYAVNNLGLSFGSTQNTFKGDFESTLFKGADVITGSDAGDKLNGYAGDDTIGGRGGNDVIAGSGSDDTINGGADNDIINGNAGADIIDGGGRDRYAHRRRRPGHLPLRQQGQRR
jgi:Ca2+-binding RTX toxin-like protein